MKKVQSHINNKGFSLVEILVAISIFLIFVISTSGIIVSTNKQLNNANNKERASALLEEGLEAIVNIRDGNFSNLIDGTYGISTVGNEWSLSGSSDVVGIFTRAFTISTINSNQKKVHGVVSWSDQISENNSIVEDLYLTNWHSLLNIGLTFSKAVINHGSTKVPTDFLPYDLDTTSLDNSVEPPVLNNITIPIVFSGAAMVLPANTYTFSTSSDPNYNLTLSSSCIGNTITLATGDSKVCDIIYEENIPNVVPIVTTPTVASITTTTATLGANVTDLGMPASISARGTCWGTTAAPTTNCVAEGGTTIGVFTQSRTGFSPGVTYYYRGYATNATGTAYSPDGTFTTIAQCVAPASIVGTPTLYDSAGSVSAVVTKPTGVTTNDIMFAHILHFNAIDRLATIPSGWISIGRHKNGNYNQALYYKVATASEGANYTFGFSSSSKVAVTISAYRGCFDTTNPINTFSNTEYIVNSTTYRAASVSLSSANSTVLMFPSIYNTAVRTFANPLTQSAGWTEDYDHGATTSDFSRAGYRKIILTSGATGVIDSIGTSGTTIKHAFAIVLKPPL